MSNVEIQMTKECKKTNDELKTHHTLFGVVTIEVFVMVQLRVTKTGGADIPVCLVCLNHQISYGRQECLPHLLVSRCSGRATQIPPEMNHAQKSL
jgi:hypothetical protein